MLLCMGRDVAFILRGGREISARRKRDGMLYDETGKHWPSCSLLITPFVNGTEEVDTKAGRNFYGDETAVFEGHIDRLPSKSLKEWRRLGEVKEVFYERAGKYDGPFRHEFNKPRGMWRLIWPFKKGADEPAILYAHRGHYRVELPEGCIVDDRGIVVP